MPEDKVKERDVSSLLAIDTSMVIWSGIEHVHTGGEIGEPGGGGGGGGGGGISGEVVPRPPPKRVEVRFYRAVCNHTDHPTTVGAGLQANGIWVGPAREHFDDAASDVDRHAQESGHGDVMVALEVDTILAGPVVQP